MQIDDEVFSSNYFSDLPTSLKNIVNWLDDFLQARPSMPVIENPVLSGEHFNRHWNQEKYKISVARSISIENGSTTLMRN
jgi:hypothetical protein